MLEFKKIAREDLEIGSAIYMNGGIVNMALSNFKGKGNFERKFKDPEGVIFDISKHGWQGTDGYSKK